MIEKIFDIHNHILWGVDDGSDDLKMSLEMLRIAEKSGTTDIILTPHNKPNRRNIYTDEMIQQIEVLKKHMRIEGIGIKLYAGNEIYYRMDIAERIHNGKASTMCGSRYVLLEFNPLDEWDYIRRGVDDILSEGYTPIIAHVERYENLMKNSDRALELKNMGSYLQINAASVVGEVGWDYKRRCKELLKKGGVSFVASDAHDTKKRNPSLEKCVRYITRKYGEEYARTVFCDNPQMILSDKLI